VTPGQELEVMFANYDDPETAILQKPSLQAWAVRGWVAFRLTADEALSLLSRPEIIRCDPGHIQEALDYPRRPVEVFEDRWSRGLLTQVRVASGWLWVDGEPFKSISSTVGRNCTLQIAKGRASAPSSSKLHEYSKHAVAFIFDGQPVAFLGVVVPPREWAHDISDEGLCVPC
jgi:hypothetical protein